MTATPSPETITEDFIEATSARLAEGKTVRRRLPVWGRVHIDRQLPFLCVYRRPPQRDDFGTDRLVLGEASYLWADGDPAVRRQVAALVRSIAKTQGSVFGAFLVLEIWSADDVEDDRSDMAGVLRPAFQIVSSTPDSISAATRALQESLLSTTIRNQTPIVELNSSRRIAPPGLTPLLSSKELRECGAILLGLQIQPVYRDKKKGALYPLILRSVHRQLGRALKRTFFEFTRSNTSQRPPHYHALGKQVLLKSVWRVDRQLAELSSAFDFLLAVTPVNSSGAWSAFRKTYFEQPPRFVYRAIPVAPAALKRKLFSIPIEHVDDPVLAQMFRNKQYELDRQLTALLDRETPRFIYSSLQLFGAVDDELLKTATDLLDRIPPQSRERSSQLVRAVEFVRRAEQEFAYYREQYREFSAKIQIRNDTSGLMVSRGNLLVAADARVPASRLEALIQHEVGTHVLTYSNGRAQPFRQLCSGLAGYEELQEGLAVMAEFLVGGLSLPRLRFLSARVVAARALTEGASFIDTFRQLDRQYEFSQATAFNITMRIYRGGGLTKDAVYLRGLVRLHKYLREGGDLEPLLIGKFGFEDVPIIQELSWRKVLNPPPLRPRYLDDPQALVRLERAKASPTILDLVPTRRRR